MDASGTLWKEQKIAVVLRRRMIQTMTHALSSHQIPFSSCRKIPSTPYLSTNVISRAAEAAWPLGALYFLSKRPAEHVSVLHSCTRSLEGLGPFTVSRVRSATFVISQTHLLPTLVNVHKKQVCSPTSPLQSYISRSSIHHLQSILHPMIAR